MAETRVGCPYQGFDSWEICDGEIRLVLVFIQIWFADFDGSMFAVCLEPVDCCLALGQCSKSGRVR